MILFRLLAMIGFFASAIAFWGILGASVLTMPYATAQLLSRVFLASAVIGPIASAASLYLGRKRALTFRDHRRTFVAGYAGIALPAILVLFWAF